MASPSWLKTVFSLEKSGTKTPPTQEVPSLFMQAATSEVTMRDRLDTVLGGILRSMSCWSPWVRERAFKEVKADEEQLVLREMPASPELGVMATGAGFLRAGISRVTTSGTQSCGGKESCRRPSALQTLRWAPVQLRIFGAV